MKRYEDSSNYRDQKQRLVRRNKEHKAGGFKCSHCKLFVVINSLMGTANRNHCNVCLWSKHVDQAKGDRKSNCHGGMLPVGLTFKHDGFGRQGELMLVHACMTCRKLSINRIARDDVETSILAVYQSSLALTETEVTEHLPKDIRLLRKSDLAELRIQLFGK